MGRIIDAETFRKDRAYAKFHKQDHSAARVPSEISRGNQIRLLFAPIQVGEVDFGEWPVGDPKHGSPRRLPLYLLRHGPHVSIDYAHGFPGYNEYLTCHCGHNHYFLSSRFPALFRVRAFLTECFGG